MSTPTREQVTEAIAAALSGFPLVNVGGTWAVDLRDPARQVSVTAEQINAARIAAEQIAARTLVITSNEEQP